MGARIAAPCPYRAQAWSGDELVAESAAAVRVDEPDGGAALYFPAGDVRADRLPPGVSTDGAGELAGLVALDHTQLRVELVDAWDGEDPRAVTTKRFPVWGDASDLVAILDVRQTGDATGRTSTWTGATRSLPHRPVVEGSQMLGQAIVAAGRLTGGRRAVTASMAFTKVADARVPLGIELDPVAAGRTFTTLATRVTQGDRVCAAGTLLMDSTAPDVIRHAVDPPDVPGPYEATPYDMSVMGRDIRIVDDAYTGDPAAPVGPPVLDAWVRFRAADLPADPSLHAGLLAQFTGHLAIAAGLRPHAGVGQDQAHRTLSTAINAITLSLHAEVRADRWLLYRHLSTYAGDGMTHAECRVHDEDGALVASFTVDAMVRAFTGQSTAEADARTAL